MQTSISVFFSEKVPFIKFKKYFHLLNSIIMKMKLNEIKNEIKRKTTPKQNLIVLQLILLQVPKI